MQERDKSFRETRRQPAVPDEPRDHAVAHVCQHMNLRVVLRCGIGEPRNSEAVDDIEQETETETLPSATEAKDRETQGSRTTPWQSIPVSFLGVSRTSCGKQPHWRQTSDYAAAEYYTVALERPPVSHVAVNYHNRALEEHTKQRSRARSSAKVTRGGRRRLGTRRVIETANAKSNHCGTERAYSWQKSSANSRQTRSERADLLLVKRRAVDAKKSR